MSETKKTFFIKDKNKSFYGKTAPRAHSLKVKITLQLKINYISIDPLITINSNIPKEFLK